MRGTHSGNKSEVVSGRCAINGALTVGGAGAKFSCMTLCWKLVVASWIGLLMIGCKAPDKQQPIWEHVKIMDIAPTDQSQSAAGSIPQTVKTINFDIHIIDVPVDKISELHAVWRSLDTRPLKFTNYRAFEDNLFKVGIGSAGTLDKILGHLLQAGCQRAATIRLLLTENESNDLSLVPLSTRWTVSFVSSERDRQKAAIGPGVLGLRVKATKVPESRSVCQLTAYPAFWLPVTGPIAELLERARAFEFVFDGAAFGTRMTMGQVVVLGPASYNSDQSTLAGLLFSKPEGTMFFGATQPKPPERKAAVRLLLMVCTGMSD